MIRTNIHELSITYVRKAVELNFTRKIEQIGLSIKLPSCSFINSNMPILS